MSSSTPGPTAEARPRKGSVFWLSFIAVAVAHFLSALDFSQQAQALPLLYPMLNTLPALPHAKLPPFLAVSRWASGVESML